MSFVNNSDQDNNEKWIIWSQITRPFPIYQVFIYSILEY